MPDRRSLLAWPAIGWVGAFMVAPLIMMLVFSFWRYADFHLVPAMTFANYRAFFDSWTYVSVLGRTLLVASVTTALTIGLAYPVALLLVRQSRATAVTLIMLVSVPLWLNTIVRNFAFYGIFGKAGLVGVGMRALGLEPRSMMFTVEAVVIVAVYIFFPYALVALYASLERLSPSLFDAAQDLGANEWQRFMWITFPLSWAGLQAAIFFVFVPSLGLFVTPAMIGGGRTPLMGNLLVPLLSETLNFARGAAFSMILLVLVLMLVLLLGRSLDLERMCSGGVGKSAARRSSVRTRAGARLVGWLVCAFIYLPIGLIVLFSFDQNVGAVFPLRGFTLQWYRALLQDEIVLTAVGNSILIAALVALTSLLVGAPAAYAVARFRFAGRGILRTVILIPIVIPELLLAASLLLILSTVGVGSSKLTIVLGQTTYVLPFVFFIILAQQYGHERSPEEAAQDLGANGWQRMRYITLPLMLPVLLGAGMVAFTLSLNDFVIAFMLGGSTPTLPVLMWSMLTGHVSPELNALSTVLIVVTVAVAGMPALVKGVRGQLRSAV
jgi:ABC-type spermidine/putrescine transport system permease subunit II